MSALPTAVAAQAVGHSPAAVSRALAKLMAPAPQALLDQWPVERHAGGEGLSVRHYLSSGRAVSSDRNARAHIGWFRSG
jgi:hypothetical protein